MTDYWHDMLIDVETSQGIMEDVPATFDIDADTGRAWLRTFQIGGWIGDGQAAVEMMGADMVARIEDRATREVEELAEEYACACADAEYELRREAAE